MIEAGKKHVCVCQAAILMEQLNNFVYPYAYKYPKYENVNDCNECPYRLVGSKPDELSNEQKNALVKLYGDYCITPQYLTGTDISEEHKIKLISEYLDENRTLFRREEERIIYTEAFRRLQYKTQIMVNSASDDQRTRLLHSLEVQKIARKIAIALKANYELAETIAIAHDIGHAPFGHAGENAIKKFMEDHLVGSFSHALQSVKVLDFLCSHRALKPKGLKGLGISDLVLEGILKHDSDSFTDNLSLAEYKLQYDCPNLYKPVGLSNTDMYSDGELYIGGIESQIVCWADKIAYLGHDWEEFVGVGLLEVMLSRINKIIIEIDEFYRNRNAIKYNHISAEEKNQLLEINDKYEALKEEFAKSHYSDKISENDRFVNKLFELIKAIKATTDNSKNDNWVLFSKEQYETLYAFFNVAYCWIIITEKKPKKLGGKIDIIFVIYKYLNDTTSHRTVPALIEAFIKNSKKILSEQFGELTDRESLIKSCNTKWQNKKAKIEKEVNKNDINIKVELRKCFAVHFDNAYADATEYISKFIYQEFIDSTRVKFMTHKAEVIVERLLDYYYHNYKMLPIKHRNRIEFESNCTQILNNTKKLLIDYYMGKIDRIDQIHNGNNFTDSFDSSNILNRIINKLNSLCLNDCKFQKEDDEDDIETIKKNTLNLINTNDEVAKDAIKLRVIADYVSGMTDRMAEMKYNEICSSGTQWSKAYSERGTFNL